MEDSARKLDNFTQAKVVGHINLVPAVDNSEVVPASPQGEDDFLNGRLDNSWQEELVTREHGRALAEISELQAENRWEDIVTLCHPVKEKFPELVGAGLDLEIRVKLSFALNRSGRHDQAIAELQYVVGKDPQHSLAHYSIGYTVLDCFYQARTNRRIIAYKRRQELIALAHHHFSIALQLRPESVTYSYRHAMLYKEIENKPKLAAPLFRQAIANWQRFSTEERQRYHQMRPKYTKSMYHLASCLLALGNPKESLGHLEKMMEEDQNANHMHPLFKHFAFGKALHALGRFDESLQHLETAAHRADRGQATDFVWELAARNGLCMGNPDRAKACIDRINPARRRPYVQWTESDVLVALGRRKEAIKLLEKSASSDRRSRHKSLIRICRIMLSLGDFARALDTVRAAQNFCVENFGNPPKEGRFWEAVCLYRLEKSTEALPIIAELEAQRYHSQHFGRLARLVRENVNPSSACGSVSRDSDVNATFRRG